MATIDKIRVGGVDYTIVDSSKATMQEVNAAITAATAALSESFDETLEGYVTDDEMTGYTYSKAEVDKKIQDSGTFVASDYYTTGQTDAKLAAKVDTSAFTEYKGEVAAELADKLEASDIAEFFDGATYNDGTKNIEFTHNGTVKATVSALPFIKDGMIDSVKVEGGKLVITWNADAGKEVTEIEITDIFDADNYYSKDEADKQFGTLEEQNSLRSDLEDLTGEVATLEADKADTTAVTASIDAAKAELNAEIAKKADASALGDYQTKEDASTEHAAIEAKIAAKADKGEAYTKAESDGKYAEKAKVEGTTLVLG